MAHHLTCSTSAHAGDFVRGRHAINPKRLSSFSLLLDKKGKEQNIRRWNFDFAEGGGGGEKHWKDHTKKKKRKKENPTDIFISLD